MDVNITIKNLPQIKRAFGMAPGLMRTALNTAIRQSVLTVERDSKILTPVDTGRLRASHRSIFRELYGEIGTNVSYDIFVHEGTRRMKGRPYLRNAVAKADPVVQSFFTKAVQSTLDRIGGMT